jgi:hypothetical protein
MRRLHIVCVACLTAMVGAPIPHAHAQAAQEPNDLPEWLAMCPALDTPTPSKETCFDVLDWAIRGVASDHSEEKEACEALSIHVDADNLENRRAASKAVHEWLQAHTEQFRGIPPDKALSAATSALYNCP